MSIVTWNCQGASKRRLPSLTKCLVSNHKVEIFVVLEPRISGIKADQVIKKLGFPKSHRVEAEGFSGGIWVLWSANVDIRVLVNHPQFIHMDVTCPSLALQFFFTAVYGSPQPQLRRSLWPDLTVAAPDLASPWLLSGDFNAILSSTERSGGSSRTSSGCRLFQSFIHHQGLLDMGYSGHKYTWRRGTLMERLDRALCNTAFSNLFPNHSVLHLPKVSSDHRPLLIQMRHPQSQPRPKPFRFLAPWLTHHEFAPMVSASWDQEASLSHNLAQFTSAATKWNMETFGEIGKKKRKLLARLAGLRRRLHELPFSQFLIDLEQSLAEELEELCFQEELLWAQKATSEWICLGDRNTSFYHAKAVIRRRRNNILQLKSSDGDWISEDQSLQNHVMGFFRDLYSLESTIPSLSLPRGSFPSIEPSLLLSLSSPICPEEVKKAIFDMHPLKAPGIDGIHALFYQSQWPTVGPTMVQFVREAWHSGRIDPQFNKTLIALIPKIPNPSRITEFRPISLCSVVYKAVTKVLANRLQRILPTLIGPFQSSFIQGRSIIDNIIIAQEVVHSMRKKQGKGGWLTLKIDLEKAFDRLRWDFIHDTLADVGLPAEMTTLIMDCISTPSMSVLWNGHPSPPFHPQRGLRQGDPLSPYIFVLCMEKLSQSIQRAVNQGRWKPIKLGRRGIPLSHLFFADDLILFGHSSDAQVEVITQTLSRFCEASGHQISLSKSKAYFSKNVPSQDRRRISRTLGIQETDSLGKYLGVPLINGRVTTTTYRYILEKVQAKLAGWKAKSLSLAGRITLATSVLTSLPLYTMQSTLLPSGTCKSIEKIIRQFIWGHSDTRKGISLVRWSDLCQPRQHGGCGILNLEAQNRAFMSKLIFKIHSEPQVLWVRVLLAKYNLSLPADTPSRAQSSHFWKNLVKCWQDTMVHLKWDPGNGTNVRFWSDSWLGDRGPLKLLSFAEIPPSEANRPISDFVVDDSWNWSSFSHLLPQDILDSLSGCSIDLSGAPPLAIGASPHRAGSPLALPIATLKPPIGVTPIRYGL